MKELQNAIGKTMNETKHLDWLGYWPGINEDGIITNIYESEEIPDDAILVDWVGGKAKITTADHGFDAVLEV